MSDPATTAISPAIPEAPAITRARGKVARSRLSSQAISPVAKNHTSSVTSIGTA
jgi:hypothetical protein